MAGKPFDEPFANHLILKITLPRRCVPEISVHIAAYNVAGVLRRSIDSLLGQLLAPKRFWSSTRVRRIGILAMAIFGCGRCGIRVRRTGERLRRLNKCTS